MRIIIPLSILLFFVLSDARAVPALQFSCSSKETKLKVELGTKKTSKGISLSRLTFEDQSGKPLFAALTDCGYFSASCHFLIYGKLDSKGEPTGTATRFGNLDVHLPDQEAKLSRFEKNDIVALKCDTDVEAKLREYHNDLTANSKQK